MRWGEVDRVRYERGVQSGWSAERTMAEALQDGIGKIHTIRVVRTLFGIGLAEAKELMVRVEGGGHDLAEHQADLLPALQRALGDERAIDLPRPEQMRMHHPMRYTAYHIVRAINHLALALVLAGCPAAIQAGAYSMHQGRWLEDSQRIRTRAAFELKCPAAQLELMPLAVVNGPTYGLAQQIGVSGCDHRAVYVQVHNDWVLNSADTQGH